MKDLLIKDPEYKEALGSLGFCLLPLLDESQVSQIKAVYEQYFHGNKVSGLIATHSLMTAEQSIEVSRRLAEITVPALDKVFEDFEYFVGGFMVKEGNCEGELALHHDWNLVDESRYASYHIWIPLEMSHSQNGGMIVLPGSHLFFGNMRSGSYGIPGVPRDEKLRQYTTDMNIAPGMGLVFHDALFHASFPNRSDQDRVAAVITIRDKRAASLYYHKNEVENCTDIYTINEDIFLRNLNILENGNPPEQYLSIEKVAACAIDTGAISADDLSKKFEEATGIKDGDFEPFQLHLLTDKGMERNLWRDGYVVFDLLDSNTVERLAATYEEKFSGIKSDTGRFSTLENMPYDKRMHYHDYILSEIGPALDRYFKNYNVPCATYFSKLAHSAGVLTWHTDASLLLNAHLEPHYAVWCPLMDVDESNGALCVVPGSHKFSNTQFLYTLPYPFHSLYEDFDESRTVLNLKAGQAVLFDIRLVHNATANTSNQDRVCFTLRMTHPKSRYYSFLGEDKEKQLVGVYEEGKDHYLREDWDDNSEQRESRKKVGEMFDIYRNIDLKKIIAILDSRAIHTI